MDWSKVGGFLERNGVKLLGGALTGPAGAVAAIASVVADELGASSPDAVLQKIESDPDALLKLKQFEIDNKRMLLEHTVALARLDVEEKADARKRDVAYIQAGRTNHRADILAFASVGGLLGCIAALFVFPIDDGPSRDVLIMLIGALTVLVKEVYGFEFGSSRGEQEGKHGNR